jgi:hypothetical protein
MQVIPADVIRETLQPASITSGVPDKYFENLNSVYGMGRGTSSYKGHYRTQHGGAIGGIYSNISFMPSDSIGIIVFTNGEHVGQLPSLITNILYDRLLGLGDTPWSERALKDYLKAKETDRAARKKPEVDRVVNTKPSHEWSAYTGFFEDAAYGVLEVTLKDGQLRFAYNHTSMPLQHYHYDRFVSADDEIDGKWSLLFGTDAQGNVHQVTVSMDEKEVVFSRKADPKWSDPEFLKKLEGKYEMNGNTLTVALSGGGLTLATAPPQHLDPYRNNSFKSREFSDQVIDFELDATGQAIALTVTVDGKRFRYSRKK